MKLKSKWAIRVTGVALLLVWPITVLVAILMDARNKGAFSEITGEILDMVKWDG